MLSVSIGIQVDLSMIRRFASRQQRHHACFERNIQLIQRIDALTRCSFQFIYVSVECY